MVYTCLEHDGHIALLLQVRLKKFVEMRGADVGPLSHVLALPALWVGLLYDDQSKAQALQMTSEWTKDEIRKLRAEVRGAGHANAQLECRLHASMLAVVCWTESAQCSYRSQQCYYAPN